MTLISDGSVIYQKEAIGIAIYENNRAPDGNPDVTKAFARYYAVDVVLGERREVTEPEVIADIERRIAEKEGK